MHPQVNQAESFISSLPHAPQLRSLLLASVFSAMLIVGAEGLIEPQSAQAEGVISDRELDPNLEAADALNADIPNADGFAADVFTAEPAEAEQNSLALPEAELPIPNAPFAEKILKSSFQTLEIENTPLYSIHSIRPATSVRRPIGDAAQQSQYSVSALSTQANVLLAQTIEPVGQRSESLASQSLASQSLALERDQPATRSSRVLGTPLVRVQGAYILQDGESSGRLRVTGAYAATPNLLFGATVDLATGPDFTRSDGVGFDVNELYFTLSPEALPTLRFTAGMIDLTSYFDRNSFAKDSLTQFFNPVFQTNPALAATGIGSRPGALVNWDITDNLNVKAAAFSSSRDLGDFALDGFAGEIGARFGNFILRGTYATNRDAGQLDSFPEIFQFSRGNNRFGVVAGDREEAFGINAEAFIPELNLGIFGRYGHYQNLELDRGGDTYSFGINALNLFMAGDRLGLGYGRQLSNNSLRQDRGDRIPDVLEVFYDARLSPNLRAGITFQERNGFSDTVLGIRVRADFDLK